MNVKLTGKAEARKSTPLTAADLRDLEFLRSTPHYQGRTEASILSEMFQRGVSAAREELAEQGYAQLAQERAASRARREEIARRRRPSWADED